MSLEQDSDALEAAARQDAWRHIRKFLGFKLCELDKSFELPNPMAQYANLAIGELPAVCRKEAAIWEKIQQRIVPAAEKMLRDKVLAPERIALYGPLLKVESENLRRECLGAIEACSRFPMMLNKFAGYIEKQAQPPFRLEPFNFAREVWCGTPGVKNFLGATDSYADFPERIQKTRAELEPLAEWYRKQGYVPPVLETITLREPDSPPVPRNANHEPLQVITSFKVDER